MSNPEVEPEGVLDYNDDIGSGDELVTIHIKIPRRLLDDVDIYQYKDVDGVPTKVTDRSSVVRELISEAINIRRERK